jgi:tRNA G18 (ribose-2'-O)-methylase SpoU
MPFRGGRSHGAPYFEQDLRGHVALALGAEREGLPESVLSRCNERLSIPMKRGIDSLNVGNSASIILYEKVRQEAVAL